MRKVAAAAAVGGPQQLQRRVSMLGRERHGAYQGLDEVSELLKDDHEEKRGLYVCMYIYLYIYQMTDVYSIYTDIYIYIYIYSICTYMYIYIHIYV